MEAKETKALTPPLLELGECKIVWKEEEKTKVGRGKITHDDENFVYLTGEKGTVIVNKKDIIAIKATAGDMVKSQLRRETVVRDSRPTRSGG